MQALGTEFSLQFLSKYIDDSDYLLILLRKYMVFPPPKKSHH